MTHQRRRYLSFESLERRDLLTTLNACIDSDVPSSDPISAKALEQEVAASLEIAAAYDDYANAKAEDDSEAMQQTANSEHESEVDVVGKLESQDVQVHNGDSVDGDEEESEVEENDEGEEEDPDQGNQDDNDDGEDVDDDDDDDDDGDDDVVDDEDDDGGNDEATTGETPLVMALAGDLANERASASPVAKQSLGEPESANALAGIFQDNDDGALDFVPPLDFNELDSVGDTASGDGKMDGQDDLLTDTALVHIQVGPAIDEPISGNNLER